jgi:hypothetical protein
MRQTISIICATLLVGSIAEYKAQDVIISTDHDTLKAKVLTITEDITSYKLESYLDGPTYELSNGRISKIIYSNGEEFSFENGTPQGAPLFNKHKNSIELVISDIAVSRAGLAYSRFIGENFEIKLEASASLVPVGRSHANYFENFGGIQFNYHPLSFRKVDYYVGIRGRMGNNTVSRYYYDYYDPYYYGYTSQYRAYTGSIGAVNGMRLNFNDRFALNGAVSLDLILQETLGITTPTISGILGVCYNF